MSDVVILVDKISKRYCIGSQEPYLALRDALANGLKAPFRLFQNGSDNSHKAPDGYIWALKNICLEVKRGEIVGLIGRNGAGKTTLLKILTRITKPTSGRAEIWGRVASLLEVGTGFHSELTGRENIYLSGSILGMGKKEIERRFDEIVAFAEVQKFIDTPVKHYSSGMYMRLAFAVAAHLDPEILLIDEVLAVGDFEFQRKCLGKMQGVAQGGRTVLFVSHDMGAVNALCEKAVLLHDGSVVATGNTREVVARYLDADSKLYSPLRGPVQDRGEFRLIGVAVTQNGRANNVVDWRQPFTIAIQYEIVRVVRNARLALILRNHKGEVIFATSDYDDPTEEAYNRRVGRFISSVTIPGNLLKPGPIFGTFQVDVRNERIVFAAVDVVQCDIADLMPNIQAERHLRDGVIAPLLSWTTRYAADAPDGQVQPVHTGGSGPA